jgi:hypothetical protein
MEEDMLEKKLRCDLSERVSDIEEIPQVRARKPESYLTPDFCR